MGRFEWIVGLVVLVVYVLGHILKAKERADADAPAQPRRHPGQELDRFLQEIDRLRKQQEERRLSESSALEAGGDDEPLLPPPPKPVVLFRDIRPMQPRPAAARPAPQLPTVLTVEAPPRMTPAPTATPIGDQRRSVARPNPASIARELLANRQTIAAAFALNEILGPPKCQRRQHRSVARTSG